MKSNKGSFFARQAFQIFAVVFMLGLLLRIFVFSSFVMSGNSMEPSVRPGDFIWATRWGADSPNRGHVVILRCPVESENLCLKRVAGVSGDRLEIKGGRLIVNGADTPWTPLQPFSALAEDFGPVIVPPDHIFVLNDKDDQLSDSRSWGPIKASLIEGRARGIWLSLDWFDGATVRTWPHVRWERVFRSIN